MTKSQTQNSLMSMWIINAYMPEKGSVIFVFPNKPTITSYPATNNVSQSGTNWGEHIR